MESKFKTFEIFKGSKSSEPFMETPLDIMSGSHMEAPSNMSKMVIQPKRLPAEIISCINQRIGDEYAAHYMYRNAANWCKNMNYKKAALYFEAESSSELDHAKMLQDYLTQWNIMPQIPPTSPDSKFTSLVDIINKAYTIEYDLLGLYSKLQHDFCAAHPATHNFIQKFVDIQNEAVGEYSDLLNALCLINVDNKLDILYFEQTYF